MQACKVIVAERNCQNFKIVPPVRYCSNYIAGYLLSGGPTRRFLNKGVAHKDLFGLAT